MPHLAQYELDDAQVLFEEWADTREDHGFCITKDARTANAANQRAALIKAIDRIYEICQTAHARELKRLEASK